MATMVDPRVGQVVEGRYVIEHRLGEGGMGVVYRARHKTLGKAFAMKILRPEVSNNEEIVHRFQQEAQSASAIGNEHIIDIHDFGVLPDGCAYFVMEHLDGVSLAQVLASEKLLVPGRCIRIAHQLAQAVGDAHQQGIVHRDLKPENVYLIRRGGSNDFVKVLDFGIAKVANATAKLTRAGEIFGTPHYMSPEQCAGRSVDHRTDIYSLGVLMYEMITGAVPFDAEDVMGILTKHMYEPPTSPSELLRRKGLALPGECEAVVLRALQKSPDRRYSSMAELAADLEPLIARIPYVSPAQLENARGPKSVSITRDDAAPTMSPEELSAVMPAHPLRHQGGPPPAPIASSGSPRLGSLQQTGTFQTGPMPTPFTLEEIPASWMPVAARPRHRRMVVWTGAVVSTLVLLGAWWWLQSSRPDPSNQAPPPTDPNATVPAEPAGPSPAVPSTTTPKSATNELPDGSENATQQQGSASRPVDAAEAQASGESSRTVKAHGTTQRTAKRDARKKRAKRRPAASSPEVVDPWN